MRIKPLDIRNHAFPKRISGYDREEVDTFLRMVAEDYEASLRDAERLRSQVGQLEARVQELVGNEKLLQETITTAQHLSEDLKRTAMKEAEVMISGAEIQGERVLEAAHRRAARLADDIREMKHLRIRLAEALRATLESHLRLVDGLAVEDPAVEGPEIEGRIAVLARMGKEKGGPDA